MMIKKTVAMVFCAAFFSLLPFQQANSMRLCCENDSPSVEDYGIVVGKDSPAIEAIDVVGKVATLIETLSGKIIEKVKNYHDEDLEKIKQIIASDSAYAKTLIKLPTTKPIDSEINGEKQTLLMLASKLGYAEIVRALLDVGASVEVKSSTGETALDYCRNNLTRTRCALATATKDIEFGEYLAENLETCKKLLSAAPRKNSK